MLHVTITKSTKNTKSVFYMLFTLMRASRELREPHQLHFDMREAALRQGLDKYRLDHPVRLLTFLLHLQLPLYHVIT